MRKTTEINWVAVFVVLGLGLSVVVHNVQAEPAAPTDTTTARASAPPTTGVGGRR